MIEDGDGWFWPDGEQMNGGMPGWGSVQWVEHQRYNAMYFASRVPEGNRHTVVCAGAHIGIMPVTYAAAGFEHVLAFEPDPITFGCLLRNVNKFVPNDTRIKLNQSALGASGTQRWLDHVTENSGQSHIIQGASSSPVPRPHELVDVVMLDQFHLQALDLLQLDVEGYELHVLEGGVNTIRMHQPVIVLEVNGLYHRYNRSQSDIDQWMADNHYVERTRFQRGYDRIYTHEMESVT